KASPLICGKISSQKYKFRINFLFPLRFLNIFKLLPRSVGQKLSEKTGRKVEIPQLIDFFLVYSVGTQIEINHDNEQ
ncbi:hypothetical protein ABTL00_20270, partial [Acinetobacter baumannii]